MTVDQKRQNCKDMRDALILHFGYKDFNKDSIAYINDAPVAEAVASLRQRCEDIRLLGSYPREKVK